MPGTIRQAQRVQALAPLAQRQTQQRLHGGAATRAEGEEVERDVDDRDLACISADGFLRPSRAWSWRNGSAMPSRKASSSPSRMPSQLTVVRSRDHLRVAIADVVQVAAVQPDLVALLVQLGADAVVLVLDPDRRAEPREHLVLVGDGIGEHRLERPEQRQLGLAQAVVARQLGGVAEVAGEHARPLHVGQLADRTPRRWPPRGGPRAGRCAARRSGP